MNEINPVPTSNKSSSSPSKTPSPTPKTKTNLNEDELKDFGLWTGSRASDLTHGAARVWLQFRALFFKRWVHSIRNLGLTLTQMLIPVFVMVIQLLYLKYAPLKPEDMPALAIDLGQYGINYAPYQYVYDVDADQTELDYLKKLGTTYSDLVNAYPKSEAFDLNEKVTIFVTSILILFYFIFILF